MQVERAGDDQAEVIDVDRLFVEIISAHSDGLERTLPRTMAAGDDDLGIGLQTQDLLQDREAFVGAVGIRGEPEVERHDRRLMRAQGFYSRLAISRTDHLIAFVSPFELA